MIRFYSSAAILSLAFTITASPVKAAAGPGTSQTSPRDPYSSYQWSLQNNGSFQVSDLTKEFPSINFAKGFPQSSKDAVYLPISSIFSTEDTSRKSVSGVDINIVSAWEQYDSSETPKRDVIVALIDTGADTVHPDLENSLWVNPGEIPGDGIDNDGNGYVDDINGWNFYMDQPSLCSGNEDSHGTHTAGIIAAGRGDGGVAGIAGNTQVKVMVLKVLGGPMGIGSPESVIKAIQYAEANGASICNLSFGTSRYFENLAQTIQNSKMLFVIASGNGDNAGNGLDTDLSPVYPAAFPFDNIISVAGVSWDGTLVKSSNYGLTSVDIAAPGSYILSTVPGQRYAFFSGTSMAAPMVTGGAALLYSYRTDFSLADVKTVLLATATPLESLNGKILSGGILNVGAAMGWGQ